MTDIYRDDAFYYSQLINSHLPNASLCDSNAFRKVRSECIDYVKMRRNSIFVSVSLLLIGIFLMFSYTLGFVSYDTGIVLGKIGFSLVLITIGCYLIYIALSLRKRNDLLEKLKE